MKELQEWPHKTFVPNGKQREVVKAHATKKHKITLLVAGNGIGKSVLGANIIANMIFPGLNDHFKFPYFTRWHGPKRIRIISNPLQVQDDGRIQQVLDEFLPKSEIEREFKGHKGYRHLIEMKNGWVIQILSNELDSNEYAGDEVGFVWFDEPFPRSIFGENLARTRRGGRVLITMTPVSERGSEASELEWIKDSMIEDSEYDCWWTQGGFEENCIDHGNPGFLRCEDLKAAIKGSPDDEYRARAYGEFTSLGGLVYPAWKEHHESVIIPSRSIDREEATIYMALDPHAFKPFVMVWVAVFPDGHMEIVEEWPDTTCKPYRKMKGCDLTLTDYVALIRKIEKRFLPLKTRFRVIDKHYGNQTVLREKSRSSVKVEIAKLSGGDFKFIDSPGGTQPWKDAMPVIASLLKPSGVTNMARLQCQEHCRNTDYAMLHHMLDARSGRSADKHGIFTRPTELHKCFPNCLEFIALFNPKYLPKRGRVRVAQDNKTLSMRQLVGKIKRRK
jgi:phage terminase large subunit-like protein